MKKITIILYCIMLIIQHSLALYSDVPEVIKLTESDFDSLVVESDSIWIVKIYVPGSDLSQEITSEFTEVAKSLKDVVQVAAVNGEQEKSIAHKYRAKQFPKILIFGHDKKYPHEYVGDIKAENLKMTALDVLKNKKIRNVSRLFDNNFKVKVDNSFDNWLLCFYSSDNKNYNSEFKEELSSIALQLKGKVRVGIVDLSINPKLKKKFKRDSSDITFMYLDSDTKLTPTEYHGERSVDRVVEWALETYFQKLKKPDVEQIDGYDMVVDNCGRKKVCILSVLPADCENKCRSNHITMLMDLADKYKEKKWCWLWFEIGEQPGIEETLKITELSKLPAIMAINIVKRQYALLEDELTENSVDQFLEDVDSHSYTHLKTTTLPNIRYARAWGSEITRDEL